MLKIPTVEGYKLEQMIELPTEEEYKIALILKNKRGNPRKSDSRKRNNGRM